MDSSNIYEVKSAEPKDLLNRKGKEEARFPEYKLTILLNGPPVSSVWFLLPGRFQAMGSLRDAFKVAWVFCQKAPKLGWPHFRDANLNHLVKLLLAKCLCPLGSFYNCLVKTQPVRR